MEEEQKDAEAQERLAKNAKKQQEVDQTAAALHTLGTAGTFIPGAGKVIAGAKVADKALGGVPTKLAAKAINKVPGAKVGSKLLGNKAAASAANLASGKMSKGLSNPSKDGFSKSGGGIKTPSAPSVSGSLPKKDNDTKTTTASTVIPTDNGSSSAESESFFGSLFGFISDNKTVNIAVTGILFFVIFIVVLGAVIFASIREKEEKVKSMAVGTIVSNYISMVPGTVVASPGISNVSTIISISELLGNQTDFKIFNREKPTTDEEGIANDRDGSAFGDFLSNIRFKFREKYVQAVYNIGNIFTDNKCNKDNCSDSAEVKFYQKVSDITYRYSNVYHVELDWPLIIAAIVIRSNDREAVLAANLSNYTAKEVNKTKKVMSLDWEYDYENIPGYKYLSPNDSRYDLQILAKNMVKKKTVQTCSLNDEIKTKKELEDVEDFKIEEEKELYEKTAADKRKDLELEYYLPCETGQKYDIDSTYTVDTDKFDDFLDEYIEKKYLLLDSEFGDQDTGTSPDDGGSGGGSYNGASWGWPLPEGAVKGNCRSSVFGPRISPTTGQPQNHNGDDYPAVTGTPVYAVEDGVVTATHTGCVVGNMSCGGRAGNHVVIDHGNGVSSVYMHASEVLVSPGQRVTRGQTIMKVGSTGSSTGPHLHITIKENGTPVAPEKYIGAMPSCH